jgi:hypothetical protein
VLDHAAPSRETQLSAVRLEREVIALFAQHAKTPAPVGLRRKVRQLVRVETARVERSAKAA